MSRDLRAGTIRISSARLGSRRRNENGKLELRDGDLRRRRDSSVTISCLECDEPEVRLVAQTLGFGDGKLALVDAAGQGIRLWRQRRSRWRWRGCHGGMYRQHPHRPFGLPSFTPEVLRQFILPAAAVAGRPWDRRCVVGVEANTAIGRSRD